ncbi:MAG: hypothetical protein IPM29_28360 [Planctomycetes bacterium]|nr:hypothetical protein [Planctomycetota bacterium]
MAHIDRIANGFACSRTIAVLVQWLLAAALTAAAWRVAQASCPPCA